MWWAYQNVPVDSKFKYVSSPFIWQSNLGFFIRDIAIERNKKRRTRLLHIIRLSVSWSGRGCNCRYKRRMQISNCIASIWNNQLIRQTWSYNNVLWQLLIRNYSKNWKIIFSKTLLDPWIYESQNNLSHHWCLIPIRGLPDCSYCKYNNSES